ncbi:uncharacterized protein LOC118183718 [Stegodyphus dumicola]|uniref:uncharacterized protein LOC118183718 n=1 Tax=Stegodyphus dumicola TaxID=202533 RepID=UPI0015B2E9AA|nr:uncharacterized protein LOC118183718 [Stegodyphus dumicola]
MLYDVTLALVTAVVLSAADDMDEKCPIFGTMACAELIREGDVLRFQNKPLEENEENLERQCNVTLPYMKCVIDFGAQCRNYTENIYYQMFKDQHSTYLKICDKNSEFRRSFLDSVKCLNELNEDQCGNLPRLPASLKDFTQEFCSALREYLQCDSENVEEKCGSKAMLVAKEITSFNFKGFEKGCSILQF